jgi:putative ABC transport system permease protein
MIQDYTRIAFKNLRRRGLRSYLTLLGILIGVAAVVTFITLGNGLRTAVNSQFGVSSTELITIEAGGLSAFGPPGTGAVDPLTVDDAEAIERLGSMDITITRNIETVKIDYNDRLEVGFAADVPDGEKREKVYEFLELETEKGRFLRDGDSTSIFLGYNFLFKDKNGFNKDLDTGDTIKINGKDFRIIGFTKQKGSFIFDNVVWMNNKPLDDITGFGDNVDAIVAKAKDKDDLERAKEDIEKLLRKRRDVKKGEENFEVSTPEATLDTINQVLFGVQAFIVLIASISIIVGAVGIVNTMTTSVLERKREIGIMKAIGAKNSDIFYQFFIESGLLGLIGGIIGVILGVLVGTYGTLGLNTFLGATSSPQINLVLIFLSLLGSFLIGSVAGILPAMQAAKQNPVEALRG